MTRRIGRRALGALGVAVTVVSARHAADIDRTAVKTDRRARRRRRARAPMPRYLPFSARSS